MTFAARNLFPIGRIVATAFNVTPGLGLRIQRNPNPTPELRASRKGVCQSLDARGKPGHGKEGKGASLLLPIWFLVASLFLGTTGSAAAGELLLEGRFTQGGLVLGRTVPGAKVTLDGQAVRVGPDGRFVLGFGREAPAAAELAVVLPDGASERRTLAIAQRTYDIQRIDGLPQQMVTPPEALLARIKAEADKVRAARALDRAEALFESGFAWPARGVISGVYGSQRILNGEPRQPHYGIDIAAPEGTPVVAPADGVVALAEPDLYYSGGTLIIDHGHGLSSALLHLQSLAVAVGERVKQGQPVGTLGGTGRVTGPHLDWRINWFEERLDPALLVPPMPGATESAGQ